MSDYPSYVPSKLAMGRYRRWAASDPKRVVAWFGGLTPIAIGMAVVGAVAGQTVLLVAGALGAADLIVEGVIYLPRAWRAARGDSPPSN
ncbi:MAG TPA: hypothetical protein VGN08_13840 [Solirubrobacteraceae bacterium]|jgi:hypothetical protein